MHSLKVPHPDDRTVSLVGTTDSFPAWEMSGMMNCLTIFSQKATFITRYLTPSRQAGDAILNPKVMMIIHQCFPLIVERHEKDPISEEASIGSLERYRKMGYDAIRNLPEPERDKDRREIDTAYQESVEKIRETVDRKKMVSPVPESDHESKGT
jgi:hypothetical protein